MAKTLITVLILYCCVSNVFSLQCYTCNNCGSGLKEEYLQTCETPDITTPLPASNTTSSPNNTPNSTTASPNNTSTPDTTQAPTTVKTSTTTVATTQAPTNDTNTTITKQKFAHHSDLSLNRLMNEHYSANDCDCENEECECDEETFSNAPEFRGLRAISFTCFKVTYRANKTDVIDRGCVPFPDIGKVCDYYPNSTQCSTCNTDKCNGAYSLETTLLPIILTMCLTFNKITSLL